MSTPTKSSVPHLERTAHEPRDSTLHALTITYAAHPNPNILLLRLSPSSYAQSTPPNSFQSSRSLIPAFKPGQWLDVYAPSIPKAGGFTITSPPTRDYLELAIQRSPRNPVAAWLWDEPGAGKRVEEGKKEVKGALGKEVKVRVGGSFLWPPPGFNVPSFADGEVSKDEAESSCTGDQAHLKSLKRVVFVAGGVGINPLISMLSHLAELRTTSGKLGFKVVFLYSSKYIPTSKGEVLFLSRLRECLEVLGEEGQFKIFLTSAKQESAAEAEVEKDGEGSRIRLERRRITKDDLTEALGPVGERERTVCYVCGVPTMTDWAVDVLGKAEGINEERVLCERWW